MPKLHSASTVAWDLLKCARCGMMVVRHWSKPAWQNMTSLLLVVGLCTPHTMPYGGKSLHLIFNKPPLVREGSAQACPGVKAARESRFQAFVLPIRNPQMLL